MTLEHALQKLHGAGRLRSPWLSGMRAVDTAGNPFRFLCGHPSGGGLAYDERVVTTLVAVSREFLETARVDFADSCTVGGLLSLFREASGADDEERDPEAYVEPRGPSSARWMVVANCCAWPAAATEGKAIAAALDALASEVS